MLSGMIKDMQIMPRIEDIAMETAMRPAFSPPFRHRRAGQKEGTS